MTTTTELGITHLEEGQAQKEAAVNAALDTLDNVLTETLSIAMGDADQSITDPNYLRWVATGTLTADRNVTVPTAKGWHIAESQCTGGDVTFTTAAGTGVTLQPAERVMVYVDGTNVISVAGLGSDGYPYDQGVFISSKPADGSTLLLLPMTRAVEFPASLTGSYAVAGTGPADGAVSLSLRKNGVQFGTVDFALSATTATFTAASLASFVPGDVLSIVAPSPQDSAFADIGVNLKGSRF